MAKLQRGKCDDGGQDRKCEADDERHDRADQDGLALEGNHAAGDARDVQQFVHQMGEVGDLAFDEVLRPAHPRLVQI